MKQTTYLERVYLLFAEPPIAYNAGLARALGSAKAAILLAQLLYWRRKGSEGIWVYKTADDIYEETCLSRHEQDTAIRKLKSLGLLHVKLKRIPATRHFCVDMEKLQDFILAQPLPCYVVDDETANPTSNFPTSITDTTSNKTQIKKPILKKKLNEFQKRRRKEAMNERRKIMTKKLVVKK